MTTWSVFERERPELAAVGSTLLYQFGVGLGFLATVRPDGGPRLHPICPILAQGGLFAFIVPWDAPVLREQLSEQFVSERAALEVPPPRDADVVFEFLIDRVLWTKTVGHGDPDPQHTVWRPDKGIRRIDPA